MKKIRVLVVDDSALIRRLLASIIDAQDDLQCVGVAPDPLAAREMIKALDPDVLTLDVEMPHMHGLEFLRRLMRLRPMPVVMVSTLTTAGSRVTIEALAEGAVEFVTKPQRAVSGDEGAAFAADLADKIRIAARAKIGLKFGGTARPQPPSPPMPRAAPRSRRVICIGASTGGTEAIRTVLAALPPDMPPILLAQHMPAGFTTTFAQRLDTSCALRVEEAQHGRPLEPGHAYLAPGGWHLRLAAGTLGWQCAVGDDEPVNRHRPSVDVLFDSVAAVAGSSAIAVLLTGMGKDGAQGLLRLRQAGAVAIAQDEASCVVYGMPREAVLLGAVDEVLPLIKIGPRLEELVFSPRR